MGVSAGAGFPSTSPPPTKTSRKDRTVPVEIELKSAQHQLGERIREVRLKQGLSQRDLALKAWGSIEARPYVSRLESGRLDIRFSTLLLLSETFGISVSELLGEI